MALLHNASLSPSKPDLLTGWVPGQPWFEGDRSTRVKIVGSFRFDDPEGRVGIETFLVQFGDGPTLQVPLTYRDAPLSGPDARESIATMEHSVLGRRWVYDAPDDPVYVATLTSVVLGGGTEAELRLEDGTLLPSRGSVRGSGSPDGAKPAGASDVELRRVVDPDESVPAEPHLLGTWSGRDDPAVLAVVRMRD